MKYTHAEVPTKKRIALVAHDNKKQELIEWACAHPLLKNHTLFATGSTGTLLERALDYPIEKFLSGPLGGDQQIGANIATGGIDVLIFFWDPFEPMPHDPDVKALLRIASVWNVPVACNVTTANYLISSPLINESYSREIPDYQNYMSGRV
ncbi:methylglyoxal synthase [Marinibactrum halimedae]|uniref:Methylglyoxal synthase n=1 Tax=Marinibactrum halimedae TaxID=1444977 RepID=A0AA37WQL3_9GAMM|nr:methylglyoxal synthase [Marinibactrum halimedae]MCD9460941.1 methylglyoxal synthase [Marinibactrum halimedae]GLS27412.1 methylglyoxal synthase [Marinibactrum halimedae]